MFTIPVGFLGNSSINLTPLDIFGSNLHQWFDTSDVSTLFTDAGVTNVSSDEDRIYQMNDKSGKGNHASQAVLANRPYYKTSVINGLDSAEYRVNQQMSLSIPSFYSDSVSQMCIFIVWQSTNISQSFGGIYSNYTNAGPAPNKGGALFRAESSESNIYSFTSSGTAQKATPTIPSTLDVQSLGMVTSGTTMDTYNNGAYRGTFAMASNIDMNTTPNYNSIGFVPNTANQYCEGYISEMVVCDVTPTAQQIVELQDHFSRWGI